MDDGEDYLALLGLLGAATIAGVGGYYNNKKQIAFQQAANDIAINLANTAHQREVRDLLAAGLNPILSATGSGAPTPSLGVANTDNVMQSFGSNAKSFGQAMSRQRALENQTAVANIGKVAADTESAVATAKNLDAQNKNLQEQNENLKAERENIKADTVLKRKQSKSRTIVGGAIEDFETHSSPTVNSGKAMYETVKALNEARRESKREIPSGVSDRTLHIMEQRGVSPEEVMKRVYDYRKKKGYIR